MQIVSCWWLIARILDGKKAFYKVPLPKKNEEKKAILETYTKEYSAEYQAQALIDTEVQAAQAAWDALSDEEKAEPNNIRPGDVTLP